MGSCIKTIQHLLQKVALTQILEFKQCFIGYVVTAIIRLLDSCSYPSIDHGKIDEVMKASVISILNHFIISSRTK